MEQEQRLRYVQDLVVTTILLYGNVIVSTFAGPVLVMGMQGAIIFKMGT
jgi:hypothetical protein